MEQTRPSLEAQILERAAKDPAFREQLKRDPSAIVAREFGVEIPQHITVEVVEETPSTVYLVLPSTSAQRGQELTDSELEAVAGGWSGQTECGTCGKPSCHGGCLL